VHFPLDVRGQVRSQSRRSLELSSSNPKPGFEVGRKFLSVHVIVCVNRLNTPTRTPIPSKLEFSLLGECIDAFAGWPIDTVSSSAEEVLPGFGKWLVGQGRRESMGILSALR
jgi:hypothetical protein